MQKIILSETMQTLSELPRTLVVRQYECRLGSTAGRAQAIKFWGDKMAS